MNAEDESSAGTPEVEVTCVEPAWREGDRLAALERYGILDTGREAAFDDMAGLLADLFDAPIAVVNLIAADRQWFKAEVGIGTDSLPLDVSICRHAILQPGVMVVPDLREDPRFEGNPLIHVDGGLRFYAGALLETPEGLPLGTLCVLDREPRPEGISERQSRALAVLASQTMAQIELRRAKDEAQAAERRQSLLLTMEERLRDLSDPEEVMAAAMELLGRDLGAGRVTYVEIDEEAGVGRVTRSFTQEGMPNAVGEYPLDLLGPFLGEFRSGRTVVVTDIKADARADQIADSPEAQATQVRAALDVPLVKAGRLVAILTVNGAEPRAWTPEEARLVEAVAERTWAAVERARAEAALRESEERLRFLSGLDEALRASRDAPDAMLAATELLARHLGASRCAYANVDADSDRFVIRSDYSVPGLESSIGTYSLELFGSRAVADMRSGRTLVVRDVPGELAPDDGREMFLSIGISAIVCCPLVKDDRLVAMMAVHQVSPRDWRADEIALMEAVVERCWAHVERVGAEARLHETSRRLDAILANTREAVFLMDERQQCVFANAAAETLTGYLFDQMKGRPLHDVIHHKKPDGSHYPLEECPIDRAFPERAQMSGEELFVAPDGSLYPVAFTASPVLDDEGKPIGTVIEARDISADKAAHERLAQLAAVGEQSLDFIGVADLQGRPVYVNEAGRAMVGLPSLEAACAVNLLDYFAPANRETILTQALPAAGSEGYWEGEVAFRRFDDSREFPVLFNLFPVRNAAGEVTHYATVTRDLTEKKNVEAELRRLNETLEARVEERTAELQETQEALRQSQKLDAMGQLTGGVAHDFNNLLTPIIASLDMLLRRGVGSERERRLMDGALQSAERAKVLVQRLLAFARKQPLQPGPVDVRRLVSNMAELIASTSGPRIDVRVELPEDLPPALADANQLEMAVLNLAVNARDAMPDSGVLKISAARESVRPGHRSKLRPGHYVRLSVKDTGTGMDQSTLARAVEPFFSTKGVGKGTGLGLSMVHGLAEQLQGGLTIISSPGQGTTVDLWLPISPFAVEEDGQALGAARASMTQGVALLVDDEDLVRMSTADMLMDLGYEVMEARSAEEALHMVGEGLHPHLVVTDHLMPGMSGVELVRDLRSRWPDLPVLIVSGYAELDGIAPGFPRLTKPFRSSELAASLAALVSERDA